MKKLLFLIACCSTSSMAAYTPAQLTQLIKSPDKFKPTQSHKDSKVNSGFSVLSWEWGKGFSPEIKLQRAHNDSSAWGLELSNSVYQLNKLAPKNKLLTVITDPVMNAVTSVYLVTSGAFTGKYIIQIRYKDGSGSLNLQTKAFAKAAYAGSELDTSGNDFLLSYPLSGLLFNKSAMCSQNEVQCK